MEISPEEVERNNEINNRYINVNELIRTFNVDREINPQGVLEITTLIDNTLRANIEQVYWDARILREADEVDRELEDIKALGRYSVNPGKEIPQSLAQLARDSPGFYERLRTIFDTYTNRTIDALGSSVSGREALQVSRGLLEQNNPFTPRQIFDFNLDVDKFKNLLDNKVYKAQMERLASNISEAVKSSKVWGVIGFTTFLGVFVAILIAVQRKDIPAPSAPIIANYFLTGCYMVYGDGKNPTVVKLDGCSSWYSNSNENSLYCKCGNTKSISEIKCSGDDKNLPFCIGKPGDTSGATKCSVPNVENYDLDVCKGQIGKEGPFVYYTSHIADALAMLPHMVKIIEGSTTSTSTNDYNISNKSSTLGLVGKILLSVVIITIILILGLVIYNTFFQNRNTIKSITRR
jgi:hypothetical protein